MLLYVDGGGGGGGSTNNWYGTGTVMYHLNNALHTVYVQYQYHTGTTMCKHMIGDSHKILFCYGDHDGTVLTCKLDVTV